MSKGFHCVYCVNPHLTPHTLMYDLSCVTFPSRVVRILHKTILYHCAGRCECCILPEGFCSVLPLSSLSWPNSSISPTNLSLLIYEVGTIIVPIYSFSARIMRDTASKEFIWSFAYRRHQINPSDHL